jgi:hypothetical protein
MLLDKSWGAEDGFAAHPCMLEIAKARLKRAIDFYS